MRTTSETDLLPSHDFEEIQALVLAAALQGDERCRAQLPSLQPEFEEPYRTVASVVMDLTLTGQFIDPKTVRAALEGKRLTRQTSDGKFEELSPQQTIALICGASVQAGQVNAYLQLLQVQLETKRRVEFQERARAAVQQYGASPNQLLEQIHSLVAEVQRKGSL